MQHNFNGLDGAYVKKQFMCGPLWKASIQKIVTPVLQNMVLYFIPDPLLELKFEMDV